MCVYVCVCVCLCLCNICMSGISMHIYAYVRVGCVHTRVHLSAHGIRVCVSVCGRDKDMKEEGPPRCLYVTQRWRGNDSSLSPTQARQRRSTADFSCFSAFFLTLSFRNVAKASVTASLSLSLSLLLSHTHTLPCSLAHRSASCIIPLFPFSCFSSP